MTPLLFAVVDAVLSAHLETALHDGRPMDEWRAGVWRASTAIGWWRSTWGPA